MYQVDAGSIAPVDAWNVPASHRRTASATKRRGRALRAVLAIIFVVVNGLGVHAWLDTNAHNTRLRREQQQTHASLNARRVDLSNVRDREAHASEALARLTARRDRLEHKTSSAGAATVAARTQSKTARRDAAAREARIRSLSECLAVLHRAMNTLSVGDTFNGDAETAKLDTVCADAK